MPLSALTTSVELHSIEYRRNKLKNIRDRIHLPLRDGEIGTLPITSLYPYSTLLSNREVGTSKLVHVYPSIFTAKRYPVVP